MSKGVISVFSGMLPEIKTTEPYSPTARANARYTRGVRSTAQGAPVTLNALAPAVYSGEKNQYGRPGHLPGTFNVYYGDLIDPATNEFKPAEQLKPLFAQSRALESDRVKVQVVNRDHDIYSGRIVREVPAADEYLPSRALSIAAWSTLRVASYWRTSASCVSSCCLAIESCW